jgi:protein SCO1/2
MEGLQARLGRERLLGSKVLLLSFTVDPARDTEPVLRAYAEAHHADTATWHFLTGPEKYLVPLVVQGFKLGVQPSGSPAGDVMHSNRVLLLDRQGRIRAYYDGLDVTDDQIVKDIRQLAA